MLNAAAPPARTATAIPANDQRALAATLGAPRVLQRLGQARDHFLCGGQLLGKRLLGRREVSGQPALLVAAPQLRRGRLRGLDTQPDHSAGDVNRSLRRVTQAARQSLPWGQPGIRLRAHLSASLSRWYRHPCGRPRKVRYPNRLPA